MNSRIARIDTGIRVSFIASAVIHLTVFLLLTWWGQLFPPHVEIQETYYVDVVNVPVTNPLSGSSAQNSGVTRAATPLTPAAAMKVPLPASSAKKATQQPVLPESSETESTFADRMAKLEGKAEARREEAVLEKLRSKAKTVGGSKVGTPGAVGTEAGSQYADFIKSRLEDALKVTSSYSTKKPEVAVRLTISAEGRLVRMKIERSSGDPTFELAVRRAIDLASEKFTAPPNRTVFDNGFVFKPKGISNSIYR